MRTKINTIATVLFFVSCTGTKKIPAPDISPEIPLDVLNERGIAVMNPNYKKSYFRIMPYLFFNRGGRFNEIQGDFYNLNHDQTSKINIMPGFWTNYGQHKNSLVVLIALPEGSSVPLTNLPITVTSTKHGTFVQKKPRGNPEINKKQQRILFVKTLDVNNPIDILERISDDVIKVVIGIQEYEFLNPEIKL